jgi:hypothetical protein
MSVMQVLKLPTNACDVENPIPSRFTPVISTVFPRICSANRSATSILSVLSLNSGYVVAVILRVFSLLEFSCDKLYVLLLFILTSYRQSVFI